MDNSKIALGNAIGIFVLFIFGLSTLSIIPAILALIFGIKGIKQEGITKKKKYFSFVGILAGVGYIAFAVLGIILYYFIFAL